MGGSRGSRGSGGYSRVRNNKFKNILEEIDVVNEFLENRRKGTNRSRTKNSNALVPGKKGKASKLRQILRPVSAKAKVSNRRPNSSNRIPIPQPLPTFVPAHQIIQIQAPTTSQNKRRTNNMMMFVPNSVPNTSLNLESLYVTPLVQSLPPREQLPAHKFHDHIKGPYNRRPRRN